MLRKNLRNRLLAAAAVSTLSLAAGNAHAYLGGFESFDGYQPFLNHVQNYNAGHYGTSNGYGGGPVSITPNTDFWKAIQLSGVSYATGHQGFDRTWVNQGLGNSLNQALVMTTAGGGWNVPANEFKYSVDTPDLGGVNPVTGTSGNLVNISFWQRGSLDGVDSGGQVAEGYFGNAIQFIDSTNTVGLQIGMTQHVTGDTITLWNGATLFEFPVNPSNSVYNRWDISLNLSNNTFSASYFQFIGSITNNLVTNQPLMASMANFTTMDFRTSPGVTNDKTHGMNLDDFHMNVVTVPEPATVGICAVGATAMLLRRPRRK